MKRFSSLLVVSIVVLVAGCGGEGGGSAGGGAGGTTATGGTGGATATGGGGAGGAAPTQSTTDYGVCNTGGSSSPLDSEVIFDENNADTLSWIDNGLNFGQCSASCSVVNEVVSDQQHYQVYEDHGLPPVDFATSVVLVTAARDGAACGSGVSAGTPLVTLVDGAPHMDMAYGFLSQKMPGGCATCNLIAWSLFAVKIAVPDKAPTFCTSVTTGC